MRTPFVAIEGMGNFSAARARWRAMWWASGREMAALLRLVFFLPVDSRDIAGRELTLALLAGLALAAWIAVDPLLHARELVFDARALPGLGAIVVGVGVVAWILARLSRPALSFRRACVLALGALPLAMLGEVASWRLLEGTQRWLLLGLSVYALFYFDRGLRLLTGRRQLPALVASGLTTAFSVMALDYLQAPDRLWVRPDERMSHLSAAGPLAARMASAQFQQQARIDAAIAKLAPQEEGITEAYFLGFAGYGQEAVFAHEIATAEHAIGQHFGSGSRSLRLVNDARDVDRWPLATQDGLRYALQELGEVMGEEDLLFLVLSSHGDRDRGLRVSHHGMLTTSIAPQSLDLMLRAAGIGWPVVIVSACYSGSFVETLADERSIVISAAAQDRKSFGCNDSRQLTYFGEAFFAHALASAADRQTLRIAFNEARAALEAKENANGILPSRPQAHFGALIEARLSEHYGSSVSPMR